MAEPENLTLPYLRRMDAKLDRLQTMLDDHTRRLLRRERRLHERDGDVLRQDEPIASFDVRLAPIERGLELSDAEPGAT